ncbi:MAG TPA: hypothetical protein VF599_22075 [Pyrinomonadaceae bacterium]|jgi:hypothetical protein
MAEDWLSANKLEPPDDDERQEISEVNLVVTEMRFDASFRKLWSFILLTLSLAETEWQFGQIGAGPLEHILGWQQKWDEANYIQLIEQEAKTNGRLNRALLIVQKYMMSDQVWMRVQSLQEQIKSGQLPLHEIR